MSSRVSVPRGLIATCLILVFLAVPGSGIGQEAPPAEPAAAAPPELPPDVTLAMLVARQRYSCDLVNGKATNEKIGPIYTASLSECMPKLLELQPNSLDAAAAAPNATKTMKSLCSFLKRAHCPNEVVEAMIRANCKEKIYKNSEIIAAAAAKCSPQRVTEWRAKYPDHQ